MKGLIIDLDSIDDGKLSEKIADALDAVATDAQDTETRLDGRKITIELGFKISADRNECDMTYSVKTKLGSRTGKASLAIGRNRVDEHRHKRSFYIGEQKEMDLGEDGKNEDDLDKSFSDKGVTSSGALAN